MGNKIDFINIIVPAVRHGMAKHFMENTVWPVWAITYNDTELMKEWKHVGAHVLESSGYTFAEKSNFGYKETTGEYLLFVGEDVSFQRGWHFPLYRYIEDYDVIGTNDLLYANHYRSAHLIMSRKYIQNIGGSWDGPGKPFHEYLHNFTDTEALTKAKQHNAWIFAQDIVIRHNHPDSGVVPTDNVYESAKNTFNIDRLEYMKRAEQWS